MPADTDINAEGVVVDVLPGGKFWVELDESGSRVLAHLSGRMRTHSIKIVLGDRVQLALGVYDLTKGRITRRL